MITVLRCRGIGEPMGDDGMLANVTKHLDPMRFVVREVPWAAQYGPVPTPLGSAFDTSLRTGRAMLLDYIDRDPNPVVLLGYSGGSALAGNVAAEIGKGQHPHLDIRGVGLISDPLQPSWHSTKRGAWGIAGDRPIPGRFPVWYVMDTADVICWCPSDSPLRTLADQSAAFSLVDPRAWGADLLGRLTSGRWQAVKVDWLNIPATLAQYGQAKHDAKGYLFRGDHTSYAVRRFPNSPLTYCEWLADRINRIEE
ncbi:MAG: hypothetical protein EOP24_27500 [Hyphomicrobiales bacterium]|nr:MAG: hypothetical protein EOP24_27500 [Hyphomicrobiales bacterium]